MHIYPVHLPPTLNDASVFFWQKQSTNVISTAVDPIAHRVAWVTTGVPRFLLFANRWQILTEVEGGRTKYESVETFSGVLAYFVKWFVGANLRLGVRAMAEGLKERAEK